MDMHCAWFGGLGAPDDLNGVRALGNSVKAEFPFVRDWYLHWNDPTDEIMAVRTPMTEEEETACPLILCGHSYGVGAVVRLERKLHDAGKKVAAIFGIDGVPPWEFGMNQATEFMLQPTTGIALMYLRTDLTFLPPYSVPFRNRPNTSAKYPGGHNDLPRSPEVHEDIRFRIRGLLTALQPPTTP